MNKLGSNLKNYISKNKKLCTLLVWAVLLAIAAVLFFCFIYSDILITTKDSINLLQTLYNGHPLGFYSLNYGLVVDKFLPVATTACYELPIFIIFALWNIPLWIAQNFFNIQITTSILSLIWAKSILIVFLGLSVWVIKKICLEININKKHISWVIFAFISSPLLLVSLFIMSQYDIIAIFFMLLGILMYIRGNLKWFIFWFAIAILLKMFALFVFIPLILLNNKKIIHIIKYILMGLVPLFLTKVVSSQMVMYKESTTSFSESMLSKLFLSGIDVNLGNASLFCISIVAIAIFCYIKIIKDKDELNKFSIYIPLLVFACFFMFVEFHPYWIILITPFIAITLFQNIKYFKINIILDMMSSVSIIIATMVTYFWCYGPLVIERMVLPKLFGSTYGVALKYPYATSILTELGVQKYMPFLLAVFMVCTISMLIVNFPSKTKTEEKKDVSDKIEWGLLFFRMIIIIPVPILMIFCYFYAK